ncbi:hypothetical protein BT96DRAFT_920980, partial [Gymnopus androsaceus JB14]
HSIFNIQCSISTFNVQFNCSAQHSKPTQHLPYRYQTQNPNWIAALSSSGYCAGQFIFYLILVHC